MMERRLEGSSSSSQDSMHPENARKNRKRRREVQVVKAESGFPISPYKKKSALPPNQREPTPSKKQQEPLLDWSETAKEIHAFGAKAFAGKQKRNYEEEAFKRLTGREKKKQRMPLPIVRGIKRKAAQREARRIQEAREAGIVLPKQASRTKQEESRNASASVHGPAPTIGFVSKGVLRLKGKPR